MIFPNRAPAPEIRGGMGYSSGAFHLGYVAHMGYAPGADTLGYESGATTLGDFSASMENAAIAAGYAPSDIDLLNSVGATDQDLTNLINGNVTLTQLYAQYGVTIPPSSTATAMQAAPPAVATPVAQVPGGSTLLYSANWTAGVGNLSVSPNSAISQLGTLLAPHGMSVVNGQASSNGPVNYGIQVTILDTIGNALVSDAKSVLDALMQQVVGNNLSGTNLSIVSTPTQSTAAGATPSMNIGTWLENNALYLGLGIGVLVLLNNFTGKRR